MKTYIKPKSKTLHLQTLGLLTQSPRGGVKTGDKVGDEYSESDVSYGKEFNRWDE